MTRGIQQATLPEVRYTVTVLIAYSETDDCTTAARSLATEDRLDLENYAVTSEFGLDEYPPPPPTFAQMIAERPVGVGVPSPGPLAWHVSCPLLFPHETDCDRISTPRIVLRACMYGVATNKE